MSIAPIRQLGTLGVIFDRDPYDLPPNAFSDGNNVRIVDGKIGKVTGWRSAITEASDAALTGQTIRYATGHFVSGNNTLIIVTDTKILQFNGSAYLDVSPVAALAAGGDWQSVQVGNSIILNNFLDAPLVLHAGDTQFAPFANWPTDLRARVIKPYQGFLVAIGIQDGGADRPYVVKWSDAFDPSGNIDPSWDETDPTTLSGENPLRDSIGGLVDIEILQNAMVIYTNQGAYLMQYVGGQFVFSFRPLFRDGGLLRQGAVVEYRGKHIVVGQSDVYMHDGNSRKSISDTRITQYFFSDQTDARSVFLYKHEARDEVWLCYTNRSQVEGQDLDANRALVYNVLYDAWTPIDLPGIRGINPAPLFPANVVTWETIQGSWEDQSQVWNAITPEFNERVPFAYSPTDNALYRMEIIYTHNSAEMTAFLSQDKIDLDELTSNGASSIKMIKRIYPQMDGTGDAVTIQAGASFAPQQGISWGERKAFDIESAYKVDVRQSGRYLALKVRSQGAGAWLLTGWDIDVIERGPR